MRSFVIVVGTLWIISGLIGLITPLLMRNVIKKVLQIINNQIIGVLLLLVGILLFFVSLYDKSNSLEELGKFLQIFGCFGLLAAFIGFLLIISPNEYYSLRRSIMADGETDRFHRWVGIITLVCGIFLLYKIL